MRRDERGDAALNNHLCLLVREPDTRGPVHLADVGFGGSMTAPIELAESEHTQPPYRIGLRCFEEIGTGVCPRSRPTANRTTNLRRDPPTNRRWPQSASNCRATLNPRFVQTLVVQKRLPDAHVCLRGRVLTTTTATGKQSVLLESAEELAATVSELLGVDIPRA